MAERERQEIRILQWSEELIPEVTKQRGSHRNVVSAVTDILHAVKQEGDAALFRFTGSRAQIQEKAVEAALELALEYLSEK